MLRCIICREQFVTKYAACQKCLKRAARNAARYFLKLEAKRDPRLFYEMFQAARLKTLTNRYEAIIKRRLRKRFRESTT